MRGSTASATAGVLTCRRSRRCSIPVCHPLSDMLSGWAVVHPHSIVCCDLVNGGDAAATAAIAVARAEAPLHHLCKGELVHTRGLMLLSCTYPGCALHLNFISLRVASLTVYCSRPRSGPKPHTLESTRISGHRPTR